MTLRKLQELGLRVSNFRARQHPPHAQGGMESAQFMVIPAVRAGVAANIHWHQRRARREF